LLLTKVHESVDNKKRQVMRDIFSTRLEDRDVYNPPKLAKNIIVYYYYYYLSLQAI